MVVIMSDDMSDMMSKISQMLNSNDMPNEIKNIVSQLSNSQGNNFKNPTHDTTTSSNNCFDCDKSNQDDNSSNNRNNQSNDILDFDINTMLKMKSIIDSMKNQKDDPRANLLMSLKPYLKPSRKQKVDQYVKLFQMGKVFEVLNPLGGDSNNDV